MYRLNRRQRLFVLLGAHLVLLALAYQTMAFDHWNGHSHGLDVEGQVGTSIHVQHCHGALGGCSGSGGAMAINLEGGLLLKPPMVGEYAVPQEAMVLPGSLPRLIDHPPRL